VQCGVARELYRFIRDEKPTLEDFRPQGALGKEMLRNRADPDAVRRWHHGISVYDDFARACELAAGSTFAWIATIALEDASGFEVSQYGREQHHYTIFGTPEHLMALVSEVRPVPKSARRTAR
jgi:hypothetical protein